VNIETICGFGDMRLLNPCTWCGRCCVLRIFSNDGEWLVADSVVLAILFAITKPLACLWPGVQWRADFPDPLLKPIERLL